MDELGVMLKVLAPYGLEGFVIAGLGYALVRTVHAWQEERAARIVDAKDFTRSLMTLQEQVLAAVNKLSDLVEAWEEREKLRERAEYEARKRESR